MLDKLTTQTAYKIIALTGIFLVVLSPYVAWKFFADLEHEAVTLFEQSILSRLDRESTQLHYRSVQKAIEVSRHESDDPESVDYSDSEIERLHEEAANLTRQIAQLAVEAGTLRSAKQALMLKVKLALSITFLAMLTAMLLAVFGLMGWTFHIRIFQERRGSSQGRATDK